MTDLEPFMNPAATWKIAGVLSAVLFHFAMEPLRWVVYLGREKKGAFSSLVYIFSSTAFFSYVLPAKLGIPLRFWLIKESKRTSAAVAGLFMAADSVLAMSAWAVASLALGGNFAVQIILHNLERLRQGVFSWIVVAGLVGIAILIFAWRPKWNSLRQRLKFSLRSLGARQAIAVTALFALDIFSYVLRHAIILDMLSVRNLGWHTISTLTVISIFAGFVSMMPMGLVGYDATIIFILTQNGVSVETAAMVPVINRLANLFVSVVVGIPSAYKLHLGLNLRELKKKVAGFSDG
jgi:uncharacterized membrane protein YbhN (UPF0104 family)